MIEYLAKLGVTKEEKEVISNLIDCLDNCAYTLSDHDYITIMRSIAEGDRHTELDGLAENEQLELVYYENEDVFGE